MGATKHSTNDEDFGALKIDNDNDDVDDNCVSDQQVVVLFYKYFVWPNLPCSENDDSTPYNQDVGDAEELSSPPPPSCQRLWWQDPSASVERLLQYQEALCSELQLKGRILVAEEGINGTVSGNWSNVETYIESMKRYDLLEVMLDAPPTQDDTNELGNCRIFDDVDWKLSTFTKGNRSGGSETDLPVEEPFPDLKISRVKEIVSTGGVVHVNDLPEQTGKHLTAEEFHDIISSSREHGLHKAHENIPEDGCSLDDEEPFHQQRKVTRPIALIDVRNTFEHNVGHFVHPVTGEKAMDPQMVTFSSFDLFCQEHAEELKHCKVLMYCTGGIRCEKASVMLKRRGVEDVNQLSGGIHRYLEKYGKEGHFKGINFTFDKRVALKPNLETSTTEGDGELAGHTSPTGKNSSSSAEYEIVGRCVECGTPFDQLCGSRVCSVCRDLVLVCSKCQTSLREYHCQRHSGWKACYFTFLEIFSLEQLARQQDELNAIRDSLIPAAMHKNARRTLARQIEKVEKQINDIKIGKTMIRPDAPRRCRSCTETQTVCDGRCWGFWKTDYSNGVGVSKDGELGEGMMTVTTTPLPVSVGDRVQPGTDWNAVRLGDRYDSMGCLKKGTVVQIKSWAGNEHDCVAVLWDDMTGSRGRNQEQPQPQIYRWGVLSLDKSKRAYDVCKI